MRPLTDRRASSAAVRQVLVLLVTVLLLQEQAGMALLLQVKLQGMVPRPGGLLVTREAAALLLSMEAGQALVAAMQGVLMLGWVQGVMVGLLLDMVVGPLLLLELVDRQELPMLLKVLMEQCRPLVLLLLLLLVLEGEVR